MRKFFLILFFLIGATQISCNTQSPSKAPLKDIPDTNNVATTKNPEVVYKTENLIIQQISNSVFVHISFLETTDYGKVSCNGMVVVNDHEAIIFDAPTNNESAQALLNYFSQDNRIIGIIPTHFHVDCVGGLNLFVEQNIPTYVSSKTVQLLHKKGITYTKPLTEFDEQLTLNIGDQKVYATYFGAGHTADNMVGYFPKDQALFGGCLIKEVGAGKGNLADARVGEWSATVRKIQEKYPNVKMVIPGHGNWGGTELLDFTIELFAEENP